MGTAVVDALTTWHTVSKFHNFLCIGIVGTISLGDDGDHANFLGFRGLVTLLPNFCQLSVPEVGVWGVYSESP